MLFSFKKIWQDFTKAIKLVSYLFELWKILKSKDIARQISLGPHRASQCLRKHQANIWLESLAAVCRLDSFGQ
jgi:hypothetical protein